MTAYRTLGFSLQYGCEMVDESETVENGTLTTVRWYDGKSVGDRVSANPMRPDISHRNWPSGSVINRNSSFH